MFAVYCQAKANLLTHRIQSALILSTIIGAAVLLTIGFTTLNSAQKPFESVFAEANGAHLWINLRGNEAEISESATKLAALPGVEASTGLRRVTLGTLFMGNDHETVLLEGAGPTLSQVARPIVTAGRYFTATDHNAIILDRNLAQARNISIGDTVEFLTSQGREPLLVIGLAINVERPAYSSSGGLALNFVQEALLPALVDEQTQDLAQVGLRLYDQNNVLPVWQAAQTAVDKVALNYVDWRDVRDSTGNLVRINVIFLLAFGLFAMFSAGLIVAATISGAVLARYRTIGLLKAVGFTGGQIMLVFIMENALLGLLGGMIGLIGGLAISPLVLKPIAEALNTPAHLIFDPAAAGLVLGCTVGLTALFSFWPARRGSQVPPVQAIRFGAEMPQEQPSYLTHLATRYNLPAAMILGLKDTYARRGRAILTTLSMVLGVVAVLFASGLIVTLDRFITDPSLFGIVYDATFNRDRQRMSDAEVRQFLSAQPEFEAFYGDTWNTVQLADSQSNIFGGFLDGNLQAFNFDITQGRMFQTTDEIVAGEALLRMTGKSVGDELSVLMGGKQLNLKIVGATTTIGGMDNTSRIFLARIDLWQQTYAETEASLGGEISTYHVKLHENSDSKAYVAAVGKASGDRLMGEAINHTPPRQILLLRPVIAGLALVLNLIALLSVLNSALMGVRERARDLAIFKAVGLTPKQVTVVVLVGVITLALVAIVVGVPVGIGLTYGAFVGLARMQGFTRPMPFIVNWIGLALTPFGICLVAMLGAALPAHWAARINVVNLLRYE